MSRRWPVFALLWLISWACPARADDGKPLSNAEIARLGRLASALVVVGDHGKEGSSFCIRPDGLFLTNHHVIGHLADFFFLDAEKKPIPSDGTVKLVMNSGREDQKILRAKVLWSDPFWDLALLRAEGVADLPALAIAPESALDSLGDLFAFGFPLGSALAAKGTAYPSSNVNKGTVRTIKKDAAGPADIEANLAINPGNSGGPLLDGKGRVVGVIYARAEIRGKPDAGFSLAVPINRVASFLSRPEIKFTPPMVSRAARGKPTEFQASLSSLFPPRDPFTVELVLGGSGGGERRHPMKLVNGAYRVAVAPFLEGKATPSLPLKIEHDRDDFSSVVWVEDRDLKGVNASRIPKTFRLHDANRLQLYKLNRAAFLKNTNSGDSSLDQVKGLDEILASIRAQVPNYRPEEGTKIVIGDATDEDTLVCSVVARQSGRVVSRVSAVMSPEDSERPTLRAVSQGRFLRPHHSSTPVTSFRVHIPDGDRALQVDPTRGDLSKNSLSPGLDDPPGPGRIFDDKSPQRIHPNVFDQPSSDDGRGYFLITEIGPAHTSIHFVAPADERVKVGEYTIKPLEPPDPKSPMAQLILTCFDTFLTPRDEFSLEKDRSLSGRFMVWEYEESLEMSRFPRLKRVAIDFVLYRKSDKIGGKDKPSLSGMLRLNSRYE